MCFGRSEENEVLKRKRCGAPLPAVPGVGFARVQISGEDGRYYFIEMNPRLPWYNGLFADAESTFPP